MNDSRCGGLGGAAGVLLLLLLSACGSQGSEGRLTPVPEASPKPSLTYLLRATTSYDFVPAETPSDLLKRVDVAVLGSVRSVKPVLLQNDGERTGGVVVTVGVEDSWKADPSGLSTVDVFLRWPKNLGLEAFAAGMPAGSRLAFFGYRAALPVVDRGIGAPALYSPDPQGLLLETSNGGLVNVWGEDESVPSDEQWRSLTSLDALTLAMAERR